jgi:hypothetical protein
MDKIDKLRDICNNDINDFRLNGKNVIGKVVDIYLVNTLKIVLLLDNIVLKFNCELYNVDVDEEASIDDLKNLCTDILPEISIYNLSKSERLKIMNTNKKIITVKCLNFNSKGLLQVVLYELNTNKNSYNDLIILQMNKDNENIQNKDTEMIFNMSPPN